MEGMTIYAVTRKSIGYLLRISEAITRLDSNVAPQRDFFIQGENRDRSLYANSSEINSSIQTEEQDAESPIENQETESIYRAYSEIMSFDPFSVDDLLKAHQLMMGDLVDDAGTLRTNKVNIVYDGKIVHRGEYPELIPDQLEDVFRRLKASKLRPLYKSGIAHHEIGKIHPFADGNGRMGRFWQSLILCKWDERFRQVPMESVISQNKEQYYAAVKRTWKKKLPDIFIDFTFSVLYEEILKRAESSKTEPSKD